MLNPTSGTTPGTIMVSVNPNGMSPGTYNGLIQLTTPGGQNTSVPITLRITSGKTSDDEDDDSQHHLYAEPFRYKSSSSTGSSDGLAALWVDRLGVPPGNTGNSHYPGLVLSKDGTVSADSQVGALIRNAAGLSLTELGLDYRAGGQCTNTSPRFVVVTTDNVSHVYACALGTIAPAPVAGWNRVRFNLTDPNLANQYLTPGQMVLDQGAAIDPTTAGGLVVIDSIDINGMLVGKR